MQERGINVDHSTIHLWVIHYAPQLEKEFRTKKHKPCGRLRFDETDAAAQELGSQNISGRKLVFRAFNTMINQPMPLKSH